MRLDGGCIRTDIEAGVPRGAAPRGRDCGHGAHGGGHRERPCGRVPRVLMQDAVGRKRSGGWVERVTDGYRNLCEDTCSQPGGALIAALRAQTPRTANSDVATWAFGAPGARRLAGATFWRAGDADGGAAINAFYEFWFAGPNNLNEPATAFGQCVGGSTCQAGLGSVGEPLSAENRVVVPGPNLGAHLYMNVSCAGEAGIQMSGRHRRPQRLRGGGVPVRRGPYPRTGRGPERVERER